MEWPFTRRKEGSAVFSDLCEMGYAEYVDNLEECVNAIYNLNTQKKMRFWPEDSLNRMKDEINKIMMKRNGQGDKSGEE